MGLSHESYSTSKAEKGGYLGLNASHPNLSGEFQAKENWASCLKLHTKQGSRGATAEASLCTTCSECAAQLIWKSKEQDPQRSGKEEWKMILVAWHKGSFYTTRMSKSCVREWPSKPYIKRDSAMKHFSEFCFYGNMLSSLLPDSPLPLPWKKQNKQNKSLGCFQGQWSVCLEEKAEPLLVTVLRQRFSLLVATSTLVSILSRSAWCHILFLFFLIFLF